MKTQYENLENDHLLVILAWKQKTKLAKNNY